MKARLLSYVVAAGFLVISSGVYAKAMSDLDVDSFNKQVESTSSETMKNPFAPGRLSPQDMSVEELYLTGIAIGGSTRLALISGNVFKEGDKVAALVVKAITKDKVVLQQLDRIHTLYLGGGL